MQCINTEAIKQKLEAMRVSPADRTALVLKMDPLVFDTEFMDDYVDSVVLGEDPNEVLKQYNITEMEYKNMLIEWVLKVKAFSDLAGDDGLFDQNKLTALTYR